ncbi:MAG: helix-turn-helix transcriptional regulator [Rhodoferax sp.]
MHTSQSSSGEGKRRSAHQFQVKSASKDETKSERVARLYSAPGGPLIGMLYDECRQRRQEMREMAEACGVTYGYINQLRNGIRSTEQISQEFAEKCSLYLNLPTIVVKLLAGSIRMSDFLQKNETEEDVLDRSLRQMMDDPKVRSSLPGEPNLLPIEAKRAIVMMYGECSSSDFFHTRELPNILFWLQRAAVTHDESSYQAQVGHRDTDAR